MADKIKDNVKLLDEDSNVTELKEEDIKQVVGGAVWISRFTRDDSSNSSLKKDENPNPQAICCKEVARAFVRD